METTLTIAVEPPRQADVERLLEASSRYAHSLGYPPDACFLLDLSQLEAPGVSVYIARTSTGAAVGIAAIVDDLLGITGRGELKRMFVDDSVRGTGVAGELLQHIETDAAARGLTEIVLETGTLHLPAQALYAKHGYRRVPAFGQYVGEKHSICMSKSLVSFI